MTKHYTAFDRPEILNFLFHPRKEYFDRSEPSGEILDIPVSGNETIGGKLFADSKDSPLMLFFHGNGEIVSDYDDLGPLFTAQSINFIPVDYRGYGRSTGSPTVASMMSDAIDIFNFTVDFMKERGFTGPLIVMGRSLGSASALQITTEYPDKIDGLIIESGFAYAMPLLRLLGIRPSAVDITEEEGFDHTGKIKKYKGPLLVIHAENDHIIPHSDGKTLYEEAGSKDKNMVTIKNANHNNIFMVDMELYMKSIRSFAYGLK